MRREEEGREVDGEGGGGEALISKDSDRRAASKRAHKGGGCAQPYAWGTVSQDLDR